MDINSTGSRKPVRKKAIGTRIAPGIPHVPGIGITPHTIRILVVSDILYGPSVHANTPGVFDRT